MKLTFFTVFILTAASVALAHPPSPPGGGGTAADVTVVDEFTNSDSTNAQDVLDDLDAAIAGGATTLRDIVTTDPIKVDGGNAANDSLAGADGDLTLSISATPTFGETTISAAAPSVSLDDTDGADGSIVLDADDANTAVLGIRVDDAIGGDDTVFIQADGGDSEVKLAQNVRIADSKVLIFDESAADPDDAEVYMSVVDGKFTIASNNGVNNENLTVDLDNDANTATYSSTGVTDVVYDTIDVTAPNFIGALTGNADTATALAANGGNCAAGSYPLGVDDSGAVESCTDVTTEIDAFTGSANIVTVGTIGTGTWEGTAVDGSYIDINGMTNAETSIAADDLVLIYDTSATANRKMTRGNFVTGIGAGQAVTFDIGDDGGNDSTDVGEIATTGDTNSIFTEPSADKILIAVGNNWPTADVGVAVTIADNEATNEENAVLFTPGGDVDGGNLTPESDGDFTYNPSSGTVTATAFAGALTGNVTGNVSGSAGTGDSADSFFSSGTIELTYGGLDADVSAYSGLIGITGGTTTEVNTAAELETFAGLGAFANEFLDDADAAAVRTTLGVEAIDAEIARFDTADTVGADWEWQDNIPISLGNDNDWEIDYNTAGGILAITHTAGAAADVTIDANDNAADSTVTITNSDGTYEANLSVEGDISMGGSLLATARDDGKYTFTPETANESLWSIGPNHDSAGDDDDAFEIRQSATPGSNVELSLQPDGDLVVSGDITVTGDDIFATTNTSGAAWIGNGTNYNPVVISGDGAIATDGTMTITDLTITSEAQGDILYFDGSNWVRLGPGTDGYYLETNGAAANPSWSAVSASAAGANTNVQYNSSGNLGAEAAFSYTAASNLLTVENITSTAAGSYHAFGADPADAGTIRLPNAGYIFSEADAAGTDISVIGVDSSEVVQIGASGASGVTITPDLTVTGDVVVGGTVQAAMDVATADANGETIATADLNTIRISSGVGDWDLPADSCDSASGVWLTVVANAAHVASITSLDASDIFVLPDGTALDAGDEVDTAGAAWNSCTVLCVATNTWLVMNTNGTCADGGTAD